MFCSLEYRSEDDIPEWLLTEGPKLYLFGTNTTSLSSGVLGDHVRNIPDEQETFAVG